MDIDPSFFPLRGKTCVISQVSFTEAEMDGLLSPEDSQYFSSFFIKKLSQKLKNNYGIEVLDNGNSKQTPNIFITVKFTKIIISSWVINAAHSIFSVFFHWLPLEIFGSNPSILEVKSSVLADGKGLPGIIAKDENCQSIFPGRKQYFTRAAEMLASQINAALLDHYVYHTVTPSSPLSEEGVAENKVTSYPLKGIAERSLASNFAWPPLVVGVVLLIAFILSPPLWEKLKTIMKPGP